MNFSFKNSKQAEELMNQLQLGQIIKVHVLEKTGASQFLISYANIQLNAVSEVDLLSKSVWLKVTQKTPFPKLQIIVEENNSNLNELFEYADANNLIIPHIPEGFKAFLTSSKDKDENKAIYDFFDLYSEKSAWSLFSEGHFLYLLSKGISYKDLSILLRDYSSQKKNDDNFQALLLNSKKDLKKMEINTQEKLLPVMNVLDRVNELFNTEKEKDGGIMRLSMLYLNHRLFSFFIPIECFTNDSGSIMTGIVKTKHFGSIFFKSNTQKIKSEILLLLENNLYINSLKYEISECVKDKNIDLIMGLQTIQNIKRLAKK